MSSRFRLGGKKSDKKKSEGEGEGDGNGDSNMDQPEVPSKEWKAWMKHFRKIPPAVSSVKAQRIITWYRRMVKCRAILNWVEMEEIARCKDEEKEARLKVIRENRIQRTLVVRERQQQMALHRIHQENQAQMKLEIQNVMQQQLATLTGALQDGVMDTLNGAAVQQTLQTQQELGQVTEQRDEESIKRAKAEKEASDAQAEVERLKAEVAEYDLYQASQAVLAEADHDALEETTEKYSVLVTDSTRSDTKAKSLCRRNLKCITVLESFYSNESYPLYKFYLKYNTDEGGVGHQPDTREEAQRILNEFQPDSENVFDVLSDATDIQQWIAMKLNEKYKLIVSHYQSMNTNDRKLGKGNLATQILRGLSQFVPGGAMVGMAVEATNAAVNGKQAFANDSAIQETIREGNRLSATM